MANLYFENSKYFHVTKNNKGLTLFLFIPLFLKQEQNLSKPNGMHAMLNIKHLILFSKLWDVTLSPSAKPPSLLDGSSRP